MSSTEIIEVMPRIRTSLAKYKDPEEMALKIGEYFNHCRTQEDYPTVLGMSLFLGFADISSLKDYGKKKTFSSLIKVAKSECIHSIEQQTLKGNVNAAFAMYWLGNVGRGDWKNERYNNDTVKHSGTVAVTLIPGGGTVTKKRVKKS